MSPRHFRANKRDNNERSIIDALEAAGCKVVQLDGGILSPGIPDLLVLAPNKWVRAGHQQLEELGQSLFPMGKLLEGNAIDYRATLDAARSLISQTWYCWVLLEVKDLSKRSQRRIPLNQLRVGGEFHKLGRHMSEDIARQLTPAEARFFQAYIDQRAPMHVVSTPAEALAAVGLDPTT